MACAERWSQLCLRRSLSLRGAFAADKLKVAIGQIDAWANMMPTLGMQAGIFQKHGIELENFGTQGAGETLQAVISGSADIGIGDRHFRCDARFREGCAGARALVRAYTGRAGPILVRAG